MPTELNGIDTCFESVDASNKFGGRLKIDGFQSELILNKKLFIILQVLDLTNKDEDFNFDSSCQNSY